MKLIKNVHLFTPEDEGEKDILICFNKIMKIDKNISLEFDDLEIIEGDNLIAIPGYIDQHVHITGGGGEAGFKTRVPEVQLSQLIQNGITTTVGLLGTDAVTRNIESLLGKAKALKEEGISTYILTGAYEYPSPTLTGSIKKDIALIDEIIGVKIAISDHRDSCINPKELASIASAARVGGMLGNKAGIVTLHMGDGDQGFKLIATVLEQTEIPIKHFMPTHVNRNPKLLERGLDYIKKGGFIDLSTCDEKPLMPANVVATMVEDDELFSNITFSSDGNGSVSKYDAEGNLIAIGAISLEALHNQTKKLIQDHGFEVSKAIQFTTCNVAKRLNLFPKKGSIREGSDADVLLLNAECEIITVIAQGKTMMQNGELLVKGIYEQ